jgi:hypothetical protein
MTSNVDTADLEFQKMEVMDKLAAIESKLREQDPMLEIHLRSIHSNLLKHEELVHILPDAQIRIFMAGMSKYKQIQLAIEATKTKTKRGGQTADDF